VTALRDASELLYPAVRATIASLGIDTASGGPDAAAAKLALHYARLIDQASEAKWANITRWLGPELLKTLEALGATPAARAGMTKTTSKPADAKPNGLTVIRNAREA